MQVIRTRVDLGITENSVSQLVGPNPDTKLSVVMTTEGVAIFCLLKKLVSKNYDPSQFLIVNGTKSLRVEKFLLDNYSGIIKTSVLIT